MRGRAEAWGGITFLNALATGVGCAAAVDLPVRVETEIDYTPAGQPTDVALSKESDTALVREAIQSGLDHFGDGRPVEGQLRVESMIPPARGLKSSSAVCGAVLLSIARAYAYSVRVDDVARLCAEISVRSGVSATGAFDDALAALEGGVVVTDNHARTVLRRDSMPKEWRAVLYIPRSEHAPSPQYLGRFQSQRVLAADAEAAARRGDFLAAMRENTELVERVVGYRYAELRERLVAAGALATGVSGMGPALASITDASVARLVLDALPEDDGTRRVSSFVAPSSGEAG